MNKILTVDPGVFTMGACLWDEKEWYSERLALPELAVNVDLKEHERKRTEPMQAMNAIVQMLRPWFEEDPITYCYCEKPQIWTSARGMAGAIKGHVLQLEMFRGILFSLCQEFSTEFKDVKILDWKGQLPKQKVNKRLRDIILKEYKRDWDVAMLSRGEHDWDALGMGFYLQGKF
jgi:hypothetical protein